MRSSRWEILLHKFQYLGCWIYFYGLDLSVDARVARRVCPEPAIVVGNLVVFVACTYVIKSPI